MAYFDPSQSNSPGREFDYDQEFGPSSYRDLEHVENAFTEFMRCLAPGGKVKLIPLDKAHKDNFLSGLIQEVREGLYDTEQDSKNLIGQRSVFPGHRFLKPAFVGTALNIQDGDPSAPSIIGGVLIQIRDRKFNIVVSDPLLRGVLPISSGRAGFVLYKQQGDAACYVHTIASPKALDCLVDHLADEIKYQNWSPHFSQSPLVHVAADAIDNRIGGRSKVVASCLEPFCYYDRGDKVFVFRYNGVEYQGVFKLDDKSSLEFFILHP